MHRIFSFLGIAFFASVFLGCAQDEISTYTVPKEHVVARQNVVLPEDEAAEVGNDRMLAAMIPAGREAWFFKLVGPKDTAADLRGDFQSFLESVQFERGQPTWILPDGWQQAEEEEEAEDPMFQRFATLNVPAGEEGPLELAVTRLPMGGQPRDEYERLNINRWREQLGLSPLGSSHLMALGERVARAEGEPALLVDFVGHYEDGPSRGMPHGHPPIAGQRPPVASETEDPRAQPPAEETVEIQYDQPEGWDTAPRSSTRGGITVTYAAAFEVTDGDQRLEITVSQFPPFAASLLPNINRWRGQVGLESITQQEMEQSLPPITVDGSEGHYVRLQGPELWTLGGIVTKGERTWFFKATGDKDLAAAEEENFRRFLGSVKLP